MNDQNHISFAPIAARWLLAVVVLVNWLAGPSPLPFSPDGSPAAPLAQADRAAHAIASRSATPVIVKQTARAVDVKSGGDRPLGGLSNAETAALIFGRLPLVTASLAGGGLPGGLAPYQARAPPVS